MEMILIKNKMIDRRLGFFLGHFFLLLLLWYGREGGIKYNTGLIMVNCFTKERLFVSSGDLKTDQIEEFMGAKKKKKTDYQLLKLKNKI